MNKMRLLSECILIAIQLFFWCELIEFACTNSVSAIYCQNYNWNASPESQTRPCIVCRNWLRQHYDPKRIFCAPQTMARGSKQLPAAFCSRQNRKEMCLFCIGRRYACAIYPICIDWFNRVDFVPLWEQTIIYRCITAERSANSISSGSSFICLTKWRECCKCIVIIPLMHCIVPIQYHFVLGVQWRALCK